MHEDGWVILAILVNFHQKHWIQHNDPTPNISQNKCKNNYKLLLHCPQTFSISASSTDKTDDYLI